MPIETNNVVERLRNDEVVQRNGAADPLCLEAADLIQSLSDRIDVLEGALQRTEVTLRFSQERLAELGKSTLELEHRRADVRASLTQGGKTNG